MPVPFHGKAFVEKVGRAIIYSSIRGKVGPGNFFQILVDSSHCTQRIPEKWLAGLTFWNWYAAESFQTMQRILWKMLVRPTDFAPKSWLYRLVPKFPKFHCFSNYRVGSNKFALPTFCHSSNYSKKLA